jgi:hypothetical protein
MDHRPRVLLLKKQEKELQEQRNQIEQQQRELACEIAHLEYQQRLYEIEHADEYPHRLIECIREDDLYNVGRCLDAGATPNVRLITTYNRYCFEFHDTPLEFAIKRSNFDVAAVLITRGAYIDSRCIRYMFRYCKADLLDMKRMLFENIDAQTIHEALTDEDISYSHKVDLRNYLAQNILCTLSRAGLPPHVVPPSVLPKFIAV